jgi:hypothetical protein
MSQSCPRYYNYWLGRNCRVETGTLPIITQFLFTNAEFARRSSERELRRRSRAGARRHSPLRQGYVGQGSAALSPVALAEGETISRSVKIGQKRRFRLLVALQGLHIIGPLVRRRLRH